MKKEKVGDEVKSDTQILGEFTARIVVESGEDRGKEYPIEKIHVTIGRHTDNDICLPHDTTVSRFHGRICYDDAEGKYFFEDLNSTNGTTIGNKWFKNERVEIKHGERIILGTEASAHTCLRFCTKKLGLKDWIRG
jgi:pSer/pThr/pTyr-binding forkhead associated (FHA) protein